MGKKEAHTLVGGQILIGVHSADDCIGERCPIHNPTQHHMILWEQNFLPHRGMIERICPHGIGHPDPDDCAIDRSHGCDGCCYAFKKGG